MSDYKKTFWEQTDRTKSDRSNRLILIKEIGRESFFQFIARIRSEVSVEVSCDIVPVYNTFSGNRIYSILCRREVRKVQTT